MNKNRYIWLDCLKAFATFMIVMQHSVSYEWVRLIEEPDIIWKIINFVFMIVKSGVPIFIMCSGVGMLQKERTIKDILCKNIVHIVKIYTSWMLIYGIYHVIRLVLEGNASLRTAINAIVKDIIFGHYHTWFIITLIALYLITPFVSLIVKSNTNIRYFLCLSIIFTIILPYIEKYEELSRLNTVIKDANMSFVVGYSLYYVMGYYIAKLELTKHRKVITVITLMGSVLMAFLLSCRNAIEYGAECQSIYTEFSILGFLISTSFFMVFRIVFEGNSEKPKNIKMKIAKISYYGIGIYLLHPLFLFLVEELKGLTCLIGGIFVWLINLVIMKVISLLPIREYFLGMKKGSRSMAANEEI